MGLYETDIWVNTDVPRDLENILKSLSIEEPRKRICNLKIRSGLAGGFEQFGARTSTGRVMTNSLQ